MATLVRDQGGTRDADQIRDGIERARQEIELSVLDLREEVARTFDVKRMVREHPLAFIGGAFAVGLFLGSFGE